MEAFIDIVQLAALYGAVLLLCVAGIAISCLALSGTWLVCAATLAGVLFRDSAFPNWWILIGFLLLSGLIELLEFLASGWGVRRRGGSRLAGVAAVIGAVIGLLVGSALAPVVGSLLGMIVGSFGLAYLAEYQRLKQHAQAGNIAFGAVVARILVVLLKVAASMGMTIVLLFVMILTG